jgi:hypothetical protein
MKLIGNRHPSVRTIAAAAGFAAAGSLSACTSASSQETKQLSVETQAQMDRKILAAQILEIATEGAFGCDGNVQTISGSNEPNTKENNTYVTRFIPRPKSHKVDAYFAQVAEPAIEAQSDNQMIATKVTGVYVSHEVVPASEVDAVQFGANNSFGLYKMNIGETLVISHPAPQKTDYFSTAPIAIEKPLTADYLHNRFVEADQVVHQMQAPGPDCGGAVDKKV